MSNPWDKPEERTTERRPRFGQLEIEFEEKTTKKGSTYYDYTLNIFPIMDGQNPAKREFSFSKGWQKIVHPSMMKLVEDGKIGSIQDLATGNHWISYQWSEFRSYDNYDIKNNKERYPEGNKKDNDDLVYASIRSMSS